MLMLRFIQPFNWKRLCPTIIRFCLCRGLPAIGTRCGRSLTPRSVEIRTSVTSLFKNDCDSIFSPFELLAEADKQIDKV
jgi:hypothetical protein